MAEISGRILSGRYEILELLGEGGMASVYKARHIQLNRLVAVKVMLDYLAREDNFKERFEREARLIAQLHHPNIIQVFDFDSVEAERLYFMVVEFINGHSLAEQLAMYGYAGQRIALPEVIRIIRDVASALSYAHAQGMMHRDIKPDNVLLDVGYRVVLTDFGLAKILTGEGTSKLTASGSLVGTPTYISPEQALGEPGDSRSDLYSLGIMMYQMVTGEIPFQATTPIAMVLRHINDIAQPPRMLVPDLPPGVESVVLRLIAKNLMDRYQTADEVIADLDNLDKVAAFVQTPRVTIQSAVPIVMAPATKRQRRGLHWGVVALLIIVGLLGVGLVARLMLPPTLGIEAQPTVATSASDVPTDTEQPTNTDTPTEGFTDTLAPTVIPCKVSVVSPIVELRRGPGRLYRYLGTPLKAGTDVLVIGVVRAPPNQQTWWEVQVGQQQGWIAEQDIALSGDCTSIADVMPPTLESLPAARPSLSPSPSLSPTLYSPTDVPPTDVPPTDIPPTDVPPTQSKI